MAWHTVIDMEGNTYSVELSIEKGKLYAIWDNDKKEIDLNKVDILVRDLE